MTLEEWMRANGKVDQAVADALDVTRSYVTRIRAGDVHPSLGLALRLQEITGGEVELVNLLPRALRPRAPAPVPTPPKPAPKKAAATAKPGKPQTPAAPKVYRARASV